MGKNDLTVQCSWCKRVLVDAGSEALVSHGICPECKENLIAGLKERQRWEVEVRFTGVAKVPVLARNREDAIALVSEVNAGAGDHRDRGDRCAAGK